MSCIPGFDDALIPRVVGAAGAALILTNHFLGSAAGIQPAQGRAESLGMVLATLAMAAPSIEKRLKELDPGRGRQAEPAAGLPDSVNVFCLSSEIPEKARQELAWASFALIKNTNTSGLMVLSRTKGVLAARGSFGAAAVGPSSANKEDTQTKILASISAAALEGSSMKLLESAASEPGKSHGPIIE
eukprot:scaffold197939_cov39-Prasinocladus_malaysianus.AAC.1